MTLTATSFKNPAVLGKIDQAMREAVYGHGQAYVKNRRGREFLRVGYRREDGFRFHASYCRDVTALVLTALRCEPGGARYSRQKMLAKTV